MSRWGAFAGFSTRSDHPLVRLTVLGLSNSGKTSLINAWVNNVCPIMYTPTETATLYYRRMRVQNFLLQGGDDVDALMSVLVEIEDTYSIHKNSGKDAYGTERIFKHFFDTRTPAKYKNQKRETPFKDCEPPSLTQYNPLAKARMGYLIVFDATDPQSFASAMEIFEALERDKTDDGSHKIYLVANKIDKDPLAPEFKRNMLRAEAYAKEKNVRFMEVSALEFTRVQRLFRDIVEEIIQEPSLWMTQNELSALSRGEKHADSENDQNCAVQ